jgi:hypothetical protein
MGKRTVRLFGPAITPERLGPIIGQEIDVITADGLTWHGLLAAVDANQLILHDLNLRLEWHKPAIHAHLFDFAHIAALSYAHHAAL